MSLSLCQSESAKSDVFFFVACTMFRYYVASCTTDRFMSMQAGLIYYDPTSFTIVASIRHV